jgi:2-keto-4-pentenoate hydratase/2-oxohepta-3-ene-1,7-dioic acid hydratase in catechol pathway
MLAPKLRRERAAVLACFATASATMKATVPAIEADAAIEALHDFRVALRRQRSLLAAVGGALPVADVATLRAEAAWLAGCTGVLRDYDVLLERLPDYVAATQWQDALAVEALAADLRERRAGLRENLLEAFRSPRATALVAALEQLADLEPADPRWSDAPFADAALWRAYRRVIRPGRRIGPDDPAERLHELRKRCKKLRYLLEVFAGLYPADLVDEASRRLRRLQNVLGDYQDYATHIALLEDFRPGATDTVPASVRRRELVTELLTGLQQRMRRTRQAFQRRFERFADAEQHRRRRRCWRQAPSARRRFGTGGYRHGWLDGTRIGLPVGKAVCVGRNYVAHAQELDNPVPERPLLFIKPPSAVCDLAPALLLPGHRGAVHHELEIALLIRARPDGDSDEALRRSVGGLGLALDLTLRDEQDALKRDGQPWERAKGFDRACPVSAFLPLPDGLAADARYAFSLHVNGELRQHGDSALMIASFTALLREAAAAFSLWPGDLVLTGTPAGVGPLVANDRLELCLDGVLELETRILAD